MIVLASKSPRRQELMRLFGVEFTIQTADIDETMDARLPAGQEVSRVSRAKAAAIAAKRPAEDIVVAADTVVVIDGRVLGKPHSEQEAFEMLRLLSGRTHEVLTGLTARRGETVLHKLVTTRVTFRPLSDGEIRAYIRTGEPMDKAGSYGIQGYGAMLVRSIDGDYFTVMGLPVCELGLMLRQLGVAILSEGGETA